MQTLVLAYGLLALTSAAADVLKGKHGQEVSACRCKGPGHTHGHCGFHFHLGSSEAEPWCRTMHGCGTSSLMKGSWVYCDVRGVDRRLDEGSFATAKEFQKRYGKNGAKAWNAAKPSSEKRLAEDGYAYTASEFRERHLLRWGELGWLDKWALAVPTDNVAADGNHSGNETSGGLRCSCKGKDAKHGNCGYHFHLGSGEDKPWCRTEDGCGEQQTLKGSWAYCDERAVERRRLSDLKLYTAKEVKAAFGRDGARQWIEASLYVERRMSGPTPLTVGEFHDRHVDAWGEDGWVELWANAPAERRLAPIPTEHEFESFATFYGQDALKKWLEAADVEPRHEL